MVGNRPVAPLDIGDCLDPIGTGLVLILPLLGLLTARLCVGGASRYAGDKFLGFVALHAALIHQVLHFVAADLANMAEPRAFRHVHGHGRFPVVVTGQPARHHPFGAGAVWYHDPIVA